jgi:RNA polymerase sigma-70 factor, ECF subfamily
VRSYESPLGIRGFRVEMGRYESVEEAPQPSPVGARESAVFDEFWAQSDASAYGLTRAEFEAILLRAGAAQNFGLTAGARTTAQEQAAYFRALKVNDLVLAQACAQGNERAWEHFVASYHEPLIRAAIAITGSDTLGRDLAGGLYAELYGMQERDGQRRCPLGSYRGRGSLMGWLRTTLAQRHVDHHRRSHREEPLDERIDPPAAVQTQAATSAELARLGRAVEEALAGVAAEERFLLAAYYLDGRTLLEIAQLLGVHEATVSRRLRRVADELRKRVVRNLERAGLSRRAALEALGADPRDVDVNLKKLLQTSAAEPFQGKAAR